MVSFNLLHRGLVYFTQQGSCFLPLFKYGMDLFYSLRWAGLSCQRLLFPLVCIDTLGSTWLLSSELGCITIIALLATIIVAFHTALATFYLFCTCHPKHKHEHFLAGAEDGFCGASAIVLAFAAYDAEVDKQRGATVNWRRVTRFITAAFEGGIIVAASIAIHIVTDSDAYDQQRSSLFVLLPCLMLNLAALVENLWEASKIAFE
ncbi:hypothetical protein BJ742DRAFT_844987 [Cladochytrium replicatum]|nr:hypothetical protein BJ742DRAFT_844987 [Cladochytrium replicatum]